MGDFSIKTCEVMQFFEHMDTDKIDIIEERIKSLTNLKTYALIAHDSDTKEDGTLKGNHFHAVLTFHASTKVSVVANAIKVQPQYINKIKTTTTAAEAYLIHANDPDKFQYLAEDVRANFEYQKKIDKWMNPPESKVSRLDEIIAGIENGEIREYNYFEHMTTAEYIRYKRSIDTAFVYRRDKLRGAERSMKCVYIYGDSGTGKTTLAKRMAKQQNFSVFVSSGSNDVLDGYQGQDCIILDDLRPSCLGLSDLLKLLDNHTASTVKSRYANKVLECKLIIVTTTLPLSHFFKNVFQEEQETAVQLNRRCETVIHMQMSGCTFYTYNPEMRGHVYTAQIPNPIEFVREVYSKEQALAGIRKLMNGLVDGLDEALNNASSPSDDLPILADDDELPLGW